MAELNCARFKELAIDILEKFTTCFSEVETEVLAEMIHNAVVHTQSDIEEARIDAVKEYIESVKYEFCMTNGLEENRKIFEVLDRIGDKYAAQKASEEA